MTHEEENMAYTHKIPVEKRWRLAARVLTYLPFAYGRAQEDSPGEDTASIESAVFRDVAEEVRDIAAEYHLPTGNAAEIVQTLGTVSVTLFGSEFETPFIEGFDREAVIRLTACPMLSTARRKGIEAEKAGRTCTAYVTSVVECLNPRYTITTTQRMCMGDDFCEMIIAARG